MTHFIFCALLKRMKLSCRDFTLLYLCTSCYRIYEVRVAGAILKSEGSEFRRFSSSKALKSEGSKPKLSIYITYQLCNRL